MKKKNKGKILAITGVILMVLPFLSLYIPNIDDIKDFNYFFLLSVYGGITLIFLSLIRKIYTESEKDEFRLSTIFKMSNYSKTDLIIISSLMGVIASKYFDFIWTKMSSFVISSMFELFLFPDRIGLDPPDR